MRWWPFWRRETPLAECISLGTPSPDRHDYDVLTVGQSRLGPAFDVLGLTQDGSPIFTVARVIPVMDERMKVAADVTVVVDGQLVGYLRPPALDWAMEARERHQAEQVEVPAVLEWGPAGPEVRLRGLGPSGG